MLPVFDEDQPRPVPALEAQDGATIARLVGVMQRLLAPDGCPWDRAQSLETIRKDILEEACEVIDAIDDKNRDLIKEELGDLLFQVVFSSELARREGAFALDDVVSGITEKLVRRHPHVFGDLDVETRNDAEGDRSGSLGQSPKTADEVLRNWEAIKAQEKKGRGLLAGVPRAMPALARAQRVGEKVQRVGFDWPDSGGSFAKVKEEVVEVEQAIAAGDQEAIEEEMGDLFFALVNLSRHLKVDAEGALKKATDKFTTRFDHVEARVKEKHGGWGAPGSTEAKLPLETLDIYWEEAKAKAKQG